MFLTEQTRIRHLWVSLLFFLFCVASNHLVIAACDPPCMSMDLAYNAVCASNDTCILVFKCEDNNPCTDDVWDPMIRKCRNTYKCVGTNPCLKYGCTANGTCTSEPKYTNDNGCYNVSCNPLTGEEIRAYLCVSDDWCVNRVCENNQCKDYDTCDDHQLCTNNHCNNVTRSCWYTPKCNDNKNCTNDICDERTGKCDNPFKCPTNKPCWNYTCNEPEGICTEHDICDDGNKCTKKFCWLGQCFSTNACIHEDPCMVGTCVNNTCVYTNKADIAMQQNPCLTCRCNKGMVDCKPKCPQNDCEAYSCDPLGPGICEPVPPCNNTDLCFRRWCENNCCLEEPVCVSTNQCVNVTCNTGNCLYTNITGTFDCNYGFGNCTNGICMKFPGYENVGPTGNSPGLSTMLILWLIFGCLILLILIISIIIFCLSRNRRNPPINSKIGRRIGRKLV